MKKASYTVIGVMSGTSLDGVDLCLTEFSLNENWRFEILRAETIPYSGFWSNLLMNISSLDVKDVDIINEDYTRFLSNLINSFILKHEIFELDAICSHGHTAIHMPEERFTYQIGNNPELARRLKQTVVCDFRVQDVELGGQGAPLVPIGDKLLFTEYDACLNLGGFANVSYDQDGSRVAFDICAVNTVLNRLASRMGLAFDRDGQNARSGSLNETLAQELANLDFYKQQQPKSLGIEWVNSTVWPLIMEHGSLKAEDLLHTYTFHVSKVISDELKHINGKVLISGGGAFNDFLMELLQKHCKPEIIIPDKEVIDYKEALIFGFLGVLRLRNEVNCLSSVTGASRDHCSGMIYNP